MGDGVFAHVGSNEPPAARHELQTSTLVVQLETAQHVQQQLFVDAVTLIQEQYNLDLTSAMNK